MSLTPGRPGFAGTVKYCILLVVLVSASCDSLFITRQAPSRTAPETRLFRLAGVHALPALSLASARALPWPEGARHLGPECEEARRVTGGTPPPCSAELWRGLGFEGVDVVLLRAGQRAVLSREGIDRQVNLTWARLGPVLESCIGAPLSIPPAEDPSGLRLLKVEDHLTSWVIHLSGTNRCQLEGELVLEVEGPGVDVTNLRCAGLPWMDQGQVRAQQLLSMETRARALEEWPRLPAPERILLLRFLTQDPDPESEALLLELARRDPAAAPDIERAIMRRTTSMGSATNATKVPETP